MSEKCSHCQKTKKELMRTRAEGFIYGKDEKTKKPMMLCIPDFRRFYELVPKQKTNVFRKKKGAE